MPIRLLGLPLGALFYILGLPLVIRAFAVRILELALAVVLDLPLGVLFYVLGLPLHVVALSQFAYSLAFWNWYLR